ncbi:helix-turn-helix transcriptional regulator [Actinotalea sp. BY-33]|uniref:Helix-turn-helix transcriptional regulator n=1 Tax=Actinotalea soli TaxID=2819234 RepID=A0A939RUM6_9CELL|nr:metalloregulator ArsR/SmtB family transcription factor [Actinotalea soli]MBO1752829.1 helix-turn-helix transcriptional regulator [Actinotalea soli]
MPSSPQVDRLVERYAGVGELFGVLASPIRVAIIDQLSLGERRVGELVEALEVSQPLVSQHLRVLRTAHLVVGVRRGREVAYSLSDEHVAHIVRDALAHANEHGNPVLHAHVRMQ